MPATGSKLSIKDKSSAEDMAETIFGDGVTVVSASYTGDKKSSGTFKDGEDTMPGVAPSDTGVILSTGKVKDITQKKGDPNQDTDTSEDTDGEDNNADFNALAGTNTYDAAYLDVDFIPTGDTMTIQFVFLSEEYPEYSNSIFNDAVGVWINGQLVPTVVGDGSNSVGNVNQTDNENLFVSNANDEYNTEMDGFTVTMTLTIPVVSGQVNSLRIGIADVSDSDYDSSIMIAGGSVQTTLVANHDELSMDPSTTATLDVLANDVNNTGGTLTVTHINGEAVVAGDSVTLSTGQIITLNTDGTFEVVADADAEAISFTYEVESSTGQNDVGFVTVNTIPCFVSGTLIATPDGHVPVEKLAAGDLVLTQDEGAQPVRWSGRRTVDAVGAFAPIHIRAGAFGDHADLLLSPQHRVLIRDSLAELLFGDGEVLVAAKDLVNGTNVRARPGGEVTYVHLLFDRHQVIFSEGLATESFLPGPQTAEAFEEDIVAEIVALFPELDPATGRGYSPAARRMLKKHEAQVLVSSGFAA